MTPAQLFEAELDRRGLDFRIDPESGCHLLELDSSKLTVSLDNISRNLDGTDDTTRMSDFVDAVLASRSERETRLRADQLFWALEPNDYDSPADYHVTLGYQADRVLIHYEEESNYLAWVTPEMLRDLKLTEEEAGSMAFGNLGMELAAATLETNDIDGVALGHFSSELPHKASLMLAPNLKQVVQEAIGWPVLAVAPARDFLYLWKAEHRDFAGRVGRVVVREFNQSAYPIGTEVFLIDDSGIKAIGAFPKEAVEES